MLALGPGQGLASHCCFWNVVPALHPALPTSLGSLLLGSVGDGAVFKEPLLRGRRHSCKLAVEHGLFVLGHNEVLRDDHRLRKALVCNGRDHRRLRRARAVCGVPSPALWGKLSRELGAPREQAAGPEEADMPAWLQLRSQSPGLPAAAALGKAPSAASKALSTPGS